MRIKLFEEYSEVLYSPMPISDWIAKVYDPMKGMMASSYEIDIFTDSEKTTKYWSNEESFTDQELNQIQKHFPNWDIGEHPNGKLFSRGLYHKGKTNKGFRIMKTADEWYYVSDMHDEVDLTNRYYKCDQLEGLFKCLNHCISIQIEKEKEREKAIQKIKKDLGATL